MHNSLVFLLVLTVSLTVKGGVIDLDQSLQDLEHLEQKEFPALRAQRSEKRRFCGRRLHAFVYATCGVCETVTDINLSMLCCAHQCDMNDIIQVCCPSTAYK